MNPEVAECAFDEAIEWAWLQNGPDSGPGDVAAVREAAAPYGDEPEAGYAVRYKVALDKLLRESGAQDHRGVPEHRRRRALHRRG